MTLNTSQMPESCLASVKSRFFGQYIEQIVAKETKFLKSPTINTTTVFLINALSNYHLELKPLSKLTDKEEDICLNLIQWLGSPVGQGFLDSCGYVPKNNW